MMITLMGRNEVPLPPWKEVRGESYSNLLLRKVIFQICNYEKKFTNWFVVDRNAISASAGSEFFAVFFFAIECEPGFNSKDQFRLASDL
jgi:hypothetical protein